MEFRKITPGVWKAEKKGDMITGKLVKVGESHKYGAGKTYHLEVTDEDTGKVENLVIFGSVVLDDRMSFVNVGQFVRIQYLGTEKNSKGQDTKMYEVSVSTA